MLRKLFYLASYVPIRTFGKYTNPEDALIFLLQIQKRVTTLISDRASDYNKGVHPKHRLMKYHDFFTERITPGEKILDIGSGVGYLAFDMAEAGASVTGIEISEKNLNKANKLFEHKNLTFILGDAWKDTPEKNFDTIVMSNVLEHIDDRVNFIRMINEQCSPTRWLIRVPCFDRDWSVALARELGLDERLDETHFIEYTDELFNDEINAANLTIIDQQRRWGEIWAELKN